MTPDLDRLREERLYRASAPVNELLQQLLLPHQVDARESHRRIVFGFTGALLLVLSCVLSGKFVRKEQPRPRWETRYYLFPGLRQAMGA